MWVKYKLTYKAVEDLTKIWDYTFDKWSEKQADKYFEMLKQCTLLDFKLVAQADA
jgi:toxin ParE1/3/4